MKKRSYFQLSGKIIHIGEFQNIPRRATLGVPDINKRVITIETEDKQRLYPELRNTKLKLIEDKGLEVGMKVQIEYSFEGSEKDGKRYNNLYLNNITPI